MKDAFLANLRTQKSVRGARHSHRRGRQLFFRWIRNGVRGNSPRNGARPIRAFIEKLISCQISNEAGLFAENPLMLQVVS